MAALRQALLGEDGSKDEFDERLAAEVVAFQEEHAGEILKPLGLPRGTGFVGPATRAALNRLYVCPPKPLPPPSAERRYRELLRDDCRVQFIGKSEAVVRRIH